MPAPAAAIHNQIDGLRFFKAYLITMRPYLLFVSGITGLAGVSFAAGTTMTGTALIFAASFLSYGFGQALTDCFQVDTDSLSSPYRPLTQGIISRRSVLLVSLAGLAFCITIFVWYNPLNLLLGSLSGFGLLTYSYFKRKWWAGPWYNAWIVAVLFLMGYFAGPQNSSLAFTSSTRWTLLTVFVGYGNFVLSGYFKDIGADRATGYRTLPVVFGRKIAAYVSDLFAFVAIVSALAAIADAGVRFPSPFRFAASITFAVSGIFMMLLSQKRLHHVTSDEEAHAAITPTVHGYILLLSAIISLQQPAWIELLALNYAAFIVAMRLRPERSQI